MEKFTLRKKTTLLPNPYPRIKAYILIPDFEPPKNLYRNRIIQKIRPNLPLDLASKPLSI
jgi:hypothetical protein